MPTYLSRTPNGAPAVVIPADRPGDENLIISMPSLDDDELYEMERAFGPMVRLSAACRG